MENNIKISVVTVCFNAAKILENTILSVINQTYPNVEYIIIDGASTDGTVDIIKKYSDKISYWVSEPDKGIYDAMNKGILAATGDYINFMNAGDSFYSNDVIQQLIPYLESSPLIISGAYVKRYDTKSAKKYYPRKVSLLEIDMPLCHQATFIDLRYHKEYLFDTSFKYAADYDFFYKAWKNNVDFKLIELTIANFEVDNGTSVVNCKSSILERQKSWGKEDSTFIRKWRVYFIIYRIQFLLFLRRKLKFN